MFLVLVSLGESSLVNFCVYSMDMIYNFFLFFKSELGFLEQLFIKNIAVWFCIFSDFCPMDYLFKWPQYFDCAKVA